MRIDVTIIYYGIGCLTVLLIWKKNTTLSEQFQIFFLLKCLHQDREVRGYVIWSTQLILMLNVILSWYQQTDCIM
jgi:hypothetical protein